jgi:hypothetical protein
MHAMLFNFRAHSLFQGWWLIWRWKLVLRSCQEQLKPNYVLSALVISMDKSDFIYLIYHKLFWHMDMLMFRSIMALKITRECTCRYRTVRYFTHYTRWSYRNYIWIWKYEHRFLTVRVVVSWGSHLLVLIFKSVVSSALWKIYGMITVFSLCSLLKKNKNRCMG